MSTKNSLDNNLVKERDSKTVGQAKLSICKGDNPFLYQSPILPTSNSRKKLSFLNKGNTIGKKAKKINILITSTNEETVV